MMAENTQQPVAEPQAAPEFLTDVRFDGFDLPEEVTTGLNDAGFEFCSPIQAEVLPISLTGKDVAGQAQTGTGKTAAFLVTLFTRLLQLKESKPRQPRALIVAPTRELAAQTYQEALKLGRHTTFKMAQIVGGIDYQKQADILRQGVDIVICTPGRLIDYFKQKIFKTKAIKIVVIDEADRLLDLGFAKDMRYILSKLPPYTERQSMLFSATLSYRVMELTYEYMNLPEFIAVAPEMVTVEGIEQLLFHVGKDEKLSLLLGLLEREDWSRVLIFTNTKARVEWLSRKLKGNGFPAEGITGDIRQHKRFKLMEKFKSGQLKILVATDVASRGIHIEDISHVINYDLPQDAESYVHRIGRTARAGKTGRALSLACEKYVLHLEPLEEMLGYKLPVEWHDDKWLIDDKCGPVVVDRYIRTKKTQQRRSRSRSRSRTSSKRMPSTRIAKGEFPGSFFGFTGPPATATPPPAQNETPSRPKKRRRGRRTKSSAQAKAAPQTKEN